MNEWLNNPLTSFIIGFIGFIIGIVGIILSFIFYFKSKVIAKPKYSIENINLINLCTGEFPKDVYMTYKGKQILRLNKTTIRFWNSGKKTIDENDLIPENLIISFSGNNRSITEILNVDIISKSRDSIKVITSFSDNGDIKFKFNYLDYKDFFLINIIHTGKVIPSVIEGDIKGVPKGIINVSSAIIKRKELLYKSFTELTVGTFINLLYNIFKRY